MTASYSANRRLAFAMLLMGVVAGTSEAADSQFWPKLERKNSLTASRVQAAPEPIPPGNPVMSDRLRPIDKVQLSSAMQRELPPLDLASERFGREQAEFQPVGSFRLWGESSYAWEAPALCHRPLYFEEENLERYGRSYGLLQPAVSVAHFSSRIVSLPYLKGAYPSHECNYTLGHTPPGSYDPYHFYRPPLSLRGAAFEAGAITGLGFIIP